MTPETHSQEGQSSGYTTGQDTEQTQVIVRKRFKKRGDGPKRKQDAKVVKLQFSITLALSSYIYDLSVITAGTWQILVGWIDRKINAIKLYGTAFHFHLSFF